MEVQSVNKPLVTLTIDKSLVKILIDTGSYFIPLGEETFKSLDTAPTLITGYHIRWETNEPWG